MSDIYRGQRVKECRIARGLSRVDFAKETGISEKFLYEIETGRKNFSAEVLYAFSKVLNVSCEYIMNGNVEIERIKKISNEVLDVTGMLRENELAAVNKVLDIILKIERWAIVAKICHSVKLWVRIEKYHNVNYTFIIMEELLIIIISYRKQLGGNAMFSSFFVGQHWADLTHIMLEHLLPARY